MVANKADLPEARNNLERLREIAANDGREFFVISAVTTEGTRALMQHVDGLVAAYKQADEPIEVVEELVLPTEEHGSVDDYEVVRENDEYVVKGGTGLAKLMRRLDLNNPEAISYLQNLFEKIGLYKTLAEMEIPEGTIVKVGELEFEYME